MKRDTSWVPRARELRAKGKSYREIGEMVGFAKETVRQRLNPAARRKKQEHRAKHKDRIQEYRKEYDEKNKDKIQEWRAEYYAKNKYKLVIDQMRRNAKKHGYAPPNFDVEFLEQNMKDYCEVCGRAEEDRVTLCVDHYHDTGDFRGTACHGCNLGVGHLGDTLEDVERTVRYLKMADQRNAMRKAGLTVYEYEAGDLDVMKGLGAYEDEEENAA